MKLKMPKFADVEFTLECLPETDIAPEDSFRFQDDIDLVREGIESGNDWAWFCAKVTARWEGFEGSACLGGCSYASWRDIETDLLPDMREEALATLNEEIAGAVAKLARAL